jgi:hypothetical protein
LNENARSDLANKKKPLDLKIINDICLLFYLLFILFLELLGDVDALQLGVRHHLAYGSLGGGAGGGGAQVDVGRLLHE